LRVEALEDRRLLSGAADLVRTTSALSVPRFSLAGAAVGEIAVFAGGDPQYNAAPSSVVDSYNARTGTWSTATLSQAREDAAAASIGTRAFFAGGFASPNPSAVVDIYDEARGSWSVAALSQARNFLAVTAVGGVALFAGGQLASGKPTSVVDIYDGANGEWTESALSQPRFSAAAATAGDLAIFAGGELANGAESSVVDLFDADTGRWSATTLPRGGATALQAASIGTRVIFIGAPGAGNESTIDLFDTITRRWSTSTGPGSYGATAVLGTKALFAGGGLGGSADIEVYDASTGLWSATPLSQPRGLLAAVRIGNQAIFAGGIAAALTPSDDVDIFTDTSPAPLIDGGTAGHAMGRALAILRNSGDADFTGPYTIQVYAIPPGQYHNAVLVGSQAVNGDLAAGDSLRFSIPISIPQNAPAGTYHLVAMVKAADGTLTPFAGATEDFTIKSSTDPKPAAAIARPIFSTTAITALSPDYAWLADAADVLG
jgi:hypothetical protein